MSQTSYTRNLSMHYKLYCVWTVNGKVVRYTYKYTGTLDDAIASCKKNVIGAVYPDFRIVAIDFTRD